MTELIESLNFTVVIPKEVLRIAEKFSRQQANPQKVQQVYLNTCAVYVGDYFVRYLGFKTDLVASDSWNPIMQTLIDTADLEVKNLGKLEFRPVLPDSPVVFIPLEVWSDRIGYVAVQLEQSLEKATLLGFTEATDTEELPIAQLRSLKDLIALLNQAQPSEPVNIPVQLRQWFQNVAKAGWQTVEEIANISILGTQSANLAYRSLKADIPQGFSPNAPNAIYALLELLQTNRNKWTRLQVIDLLGNIATGNSEAIASLTDLLQTTQDEDSRRQIAVSLGKIAPGNPDAGVRRARVIELGMQLSRHRVVLVVTLTPEANEKTEIHLRVYPIDTPALPQNLHLSVLDESGNTFREAHSESADDWIQLKFRGNLGDLFSIKVALGDATFSEEFVI